MKRKEDSTKQTNQHNHDVKVTVDTIHLTAKLSNKEEETLYEGFNFTKNKKGFHWHYTQKDTRKLGFVIHARPTNTFTCSHYNHMIQMQKQIISSVYVPSSLDTVIKTINWQIKRMDIAFDFKCSKEQSVIIKHHGNAQFEAANEEWNTEYLGKLSTRSEAKLANYDRNKKEAERETGITHEYSNRFEVRLFAASNNPSMQLHNLQDDFIIKHLKKYKIIVNIDELPVKKVIKRWLYNLQKDPDFMKKLNDKKKKELKAAIEAHKVPLDQLYLANKAKLLPFLAEQTEAAKKAV